MLAVKIHHGNLSNNRDSEELRRLAVEVPSFLVSEMRSEMPPSGPAQSFSPWPLHLNACVLPPPRICSLFLTTKVHNLQAITDVVKGRGN